VLALLRFRIRPRGSALRSKLRLPIGLGMVAQIAIENTVVAGFASAIRAFHFGGERFAIAGDALPCAPTAARLCFGLSLLLTAFILPVALSSVSIERAATLCVPRVFRVARGPPRRRYMRGAWCSTRRFPEDTVGTAYDFGGRGEYSTRRYYDA
jgi:hypothetical protein